MHGFVTDQTRHGERSHRTSHCAQYYVERAPSMPIDSTRIQGDLISDEPQQPHLVSLWG